MDHETPVRQSIGIFNDNKIDKTWIPEVEFIVIKCDFEWKAILTRINLEYVCEVKNSKSNDIYFSSIITNSVAKGHIQRQMQNSMGNAKYIVKAF